MIRRIHAKYNDFLFITNTFCFLAMQFIPEHWLLTRLIVEIIWTITILSWIVLSLCMLSLKVTKR